MVNRLRIKNFCENLKSKWIVMLVEKIVNFSIDEKYLNIFINYVFMNF